MVGASFAASVPFAIFSYLFIRDKPVLWVPVGPYLLLPLAYLVTEMVPLGLKLERAAATALPIVMITFSVWTACSWILLSFADSRRGRPKWGPGTESAAMVFLFAPLIF